jgi:hypothetical protein
MEQDIPFFIRSFFGNPFISYLSSSPAYPVDRSSEERRTNRKEQGVILVVRFIDIIDTVSSDLPGEKSENSEKKR